MTFLAVVLFGAGVILIGSSLDDTPILATIGKILAGQELDWSGGAAPGAGTSVGGQRSAVGSVTTPAATPPRINIL